MSFKKTLLQIVQAMSRGINGDEISTLTDGSIETEDLTSLALDVLKDIISRNDWEFLRDRPMKLEAGTYAIELAIPDTVQRVQTVRYRRMMGGVQNGFATLRYLPPEDFVKQLQSGNPAEPNRVTVTVNGVEMYPYTNRHPRYWTSFDEKNVVIDSYDVDQNPTGVDPDDSAILATIYLDLTGSDDGAWVAPIPDKLFQLWEQEAIAEASVNMRQAENPRAERKARRSYIQQIKREPVTRRDEGSQEVNYGR